MVFEASALRARAPHPGHLHRVACAALGLSAILASLAFSSFTCALAWPRLASEKRAKSPMKAQRRMKKLERNAKTGDLSMKMSKVFMAVIVKLTAKDLIIPYLRYM